MQKHPSTFFALWTQWIVLNALPSAAAVFDVDGATPCVETVSLGASCQVYYEGEYTLGQARTSLPRTEQSSALPQPC